MLAMNALKNQINKLRTFIYILIILFIINIIFNLAFQWEGISIIVNIYLFVFSFYLIFNFSLIDITSLKEEYFKLSGKFGIYKLFIYFRVVPFIIIYFITVIFTLINYLDKNNWPWRAILDLLDGRYSNTVFYSLILLIVLKLKREPRITIPLFLIMSMIYFLIYRLVYTFSPSGLAVSGLKLFQVSIALFFLVYEFFFDKKNIIKSIIVSLFVSIILYFSLVGVISTIYRLSKFASYKQIRSSHLLLKMGYSFPLPVMQSVVVETSRPDLLIYLVHYSKQFNYYIDMTSSEWENLLLSGPIETADIIFDYIKNKKIIISYDQLVSYAERRSIDSGKKLIIALNYIKYTAPYFENNMDDFLNRLNRGNLDYKIWSLRVIAESKSIKAVPFLINMLTNINDKLSQEAYSALSEITRIDPAKEMNINMNSPEVLLKFKEYYISHLNKKN